MVSSFLTEFAASEGLTDIELNVLANADVRSAEDIDSLVRAFPSIADEGVRLPRLSNAVSWRLNATYAAIAASVAAHPPSVGMGAEAPPGSPHQIGSPAGGAGALPPGSGGSPGGNGPPAGSGPIDLRRQPWPVRDQGDRGTCVAFGTAACVEHVLAGTPAGANDYAEQFLYWAIKTGTQDPKPNHDGTWLCFARDALSGTGICEETLWPYVSFPQNPVSGQTGQDPSPTALADAACRCGIAAGHTYRIRPSGAAALLLGLLRLRRPVAMTLPVFRDPFAPPTGPTNWTTPAGFSYGRVINPPRLSVVIGGHCTCVTGYQPDPADPLGGHFIVRNSWGTGWAAQAPSAGNSLSPEPGYGYLSAAYVDRFCWELLQL